jgi:alpha-glucosidase
MSDVRPAPWWRRGVVYQIYPRSFQDSDGDGIGDLPGILARLDYLAWLGVDALWISPIYPSPMRDFGYDVTDLTGVDPRFGTLEDLDALVEAAHARGLRIVLDVVPNHTSDEHPWFLASRRSRSDPRRDWYLWRDPAPGGGPPTNWRGVDALDTPGSVWRWDEATGQYYLASFSSFQPDLNWAHPEVRDAFARALRFWLERGVDGFRLDMVDFLGKDPELRDEPPATAAADDWLAAARYQLHLERTLAHVREIRATVHAWPDRVLIGEVLYSLAPAQIARYYDGGAGLDLPMHFGLMFLPMEARPLRARIDAYEAAIGEGWPSYDLANHDMPRLSRHGANARLAAMLLLTLRGTPFLYYGDEIGMANVDVPAERRLDPFVIYLTGLSRDGVRTPMQWRDAPHAGFSHVEPWLPVAPDARRVNVAAERDDPTSMLTLHRRLLALRRAEPALQLGAYRPRDDVPGDVLAYLREAGDATFLVALNPTGEVRRVPLPGDASWRAELSTRLDGGPERAHGSLRLRPHEGAVLRRTAP